MSVEQVMAEIDRDIPFYDESGGGVTLSGGEPLFQPDFALDLLQACKTKEIRTTLDTCGFVAWDTFDHVRNYVGLFMYDLKLLNDARHRHFTGVSNERILKNLLTLSQLGHAIILRVPIIPGVNDDQENLSQLGSFAASLPHLKRVDLLPYHRIGIDKYARLHQVYRLPNTRAPSDRRMAEIAHVFEPFEIPINIGG
jgi:pyruvate formate lyase activating enzyme